MQSNPAGLACRREGIQYSQDLINRLDSKARHAQFPFRVCLDSGDGPSGVNRLLYLEEIKASVDGIFRHSGRRS